MDNVRQILSLMPKPIRLLRQFHHPGRDYLLSGFLHNGGSLSGLLLQRLLCIGHPFVGYSSDAGNTNRSDDEANDKTSDKLDQSFSSGKMEYTTSDWIMSPL